MKAVIISSEKKNYFWKLNLSNESIHEGLVILDQTFRYKHIKAFARMCDTVAIIHSMC